jgi:ATP-dependent DNA helicase RecG
MFFLLNAMSITVTRMADDEVEVLLTTEEGHFVDLKAVDISPASVTKAVSAFANTAGGELFIGVDERIGDAGRERTWRGFSTPEDANGLIQALEGMSPLGNHYTVDFLANEKQDGLVAHVNVFKAREILAASNGKIYVRRGAQKLPVEGEEALRRLKYDKGITSFEDELIDVPVDELSNSVTIIEFMLTVVPSAEPEAFLEKQRVVLKGRPTVAGILLFADEPQAILPKRSAIKIFRYQTKSEGERDTLAFDPITIEGPVYDLIYKAVDTCKKLIESIQKLGPSGLESISYPEEALHEIVTNAVLHRDYSIAADVQIRIFDDRVEIESPGRFPGHVTAKNVLNEQFARNAKVVRLVNKFPNAPNKDVGEGLNTAFEAMEKLRLKAPTIEERDNSVLVTLRHEKLASPEQLVLEYVETHEEITNLIARDLTGIKSENSMKDVFYRLRNRGLLEPVPGKLVGNRAAWRKKK